MQVFSGENGDRISADDYLLLFVDDIISQSDEVLAKLQRLKDKGVHVIIIGFGKSDEVIGELYEKMASHPSDVNYMSSVLLKHIVGDLTAITCRKVDCEHLEKKEKNTKGKLYQKPLPADNLTKNKKKHTPKNNVLYNKTTI